MSITQRTISTLRRHRTHRRDALHTVRDSPSNTALSETGSYRFIRDY